MRYELDMDDEGNRLWICCHDNGSYEPLPPDFALQLNSEPGSGFPLGTVVTIEQPDARVAGEGEVAKLRAIFKRKLRKASATGGKDLTDEELEGMADALFAKGRDLVFARQAMRGDGPL